MTWFKIDDSFYDHPKVFDASDSAVALWVRAGCWSARNLTDGVIPGRLAFRLCDDPMKAAAELVERRLWEQIGDDYLFHDWHEYQPAREDVLRKRDEAAERMRAHRAKQAQARSGTRSPERSPERSGELHAKFAPPDPTRPDQGSKEPSLFTADAVDTHTEKPGPNRRKPETEAPEFFPITEKMRDWARKEVPAVADALEFHTKEFLDHHAAKGNRFRDWGRAWHKWMRNAAKFAAERQSRPNNVVAIRGNDRMAAKHDMLAEAMERARVLDALEAGGMA